MKSVGLIDPNRLRNIPLKHQPEHEFCFHLHDLMVSLLVEMDVQKAGRVSFDLADEADRRLLQSGIHVLDFLAQTGRGDLERRAAINHLSGALFADMLHFIYEGLIALEKRKFSVAFSLLRKPFKEGMWLVAQMCGDEVDFFNRMKTDAKNLLNLGLFNDASVKAHFAAALKACPGTEFTNPDMLYSLVFDRKDAFGLAQLFDKATHLSTLFSQVQTENYNINFIFKDPDDDDIYQSIYRQLSILLLFLHVMQIALYGRMQAPKERYRKWLLFTSIGTFEALYGKGRSRMVAFLNSSAGELLACPNCTAKIRLRKADAARLFIAEVLVCEACHTMHHFPLRWLLSKVDREVPT